MEGNTKKYPTKYKQYDVYNGCLMYLNIPKVMSFSGIPQLIEYTPLALRPKNAIAVPNEIRINPVI